MFIFAKLGGEGEGSIGVFDLAITAPLVLVMILLFSMTLFAIGYAFYSIQVFRWRRRERANLVLDLLEVGLRNGQTVEQTLLSACGTGDRMLPARFYRLADYLESGLSLSDSLAHAPRFLPSAVQALFQLGARHGVIPRLLPACRAALDEPPHARMVAAQQIAFYLVYGAAQCAGILFFLRIIVLPKFKLIAEELIGTRVETLSSIMAAAGAISLLNLVLGGVLALWLFGRIGGFRRLELGASPRFAIVDRLLLWIPWRRARLRRNFAAALAALLDCGLPESVAVREAAQATGSRWFQNRADEVCRALERGVGLAEALEHLDDAGELRWRLTNARHGRGGFLAALRGWLSSLDTRANSQEHASAEAFISVSLLVQGLAVGLAVTGMFGTLVVITERAINW